LKADLLLKEEGLNWEAVLTPAYAAERCDLALELIVRGWPAKAAAGIAACLNVPEEGTAPNLAGWRDGRWNQFLDWASAHGGRDPNVGGGAVGLPLAQSSGGIFRTGRQAERRLDGEGGLGPLQTVHRRDQTGRTTNLGEAG
jgi:hypothetical protein